MIMKLPMVEAGFLLSYLLLLLQLLLPASLLQQTGLLTPTDPYLLVGENLTLLCTELMTLSSPAGPPAGPLQGMHFKHVPSGRVLHGEQVTPNSVRLLRHDVTLDDKGLYVCKHGDVVIAGTDVGVGYLPQKVTDLKCIIKNGRSMLCDWCPHPMTDTTIKWNLYYSINGEVFMDCYKDQRKKHNSNCTCYWPSEDEVNDLNLERSDVFQFGFDYDVVIEAKNIYSKSKNLTLRSNFTVNAYSVDIVVPNAVGKLQATAVNSTCLQVKWESPDKFPVLPLLYSIKYSSENNVSQIVNTSMTEVLLTKLHPFMQYTVQVACVPIHGHLWSEAITVKSWTLSAAPSVAPTLTPGSFRQTYCETPDCADITLMWKNVDKRHRNGILTSFNIDILDNTANGITRQTVTATQFQAVISLNAHHSYTVGLSASNEAGSSPSSFINIEKNYNRPELPKLITAEISCADCPYPYLDIWWTSLGQETAYEIFYCTAMKQSSIDVCQGDLHSIKFNANEKSKRLEYSPERLYSLAVYHGNISSGMSDWLCTYTYDGVLPNVEFTFPEKQSERSLRIEIPKISCTKQGQGRVLEYLLSWCLLLSNQSCSKTKNTTIDADSRSYQIKNLLPFATYKVDLLATGHKNHHFFRKSIRTKQSAPSDAPNNIQIKEISCHAVSVEWKPPLYLNGVLKEYRVIHYKTNLKHNLMKKVTKTSSAVIDGLDGYSKYTFLFYAVTTDQSPQANITVTTDICAPSVMSAPRVDVIDSYIDSSQVKLSWQNPEPANGEVAWYQVLAAGMTNNYTWNVSGLQLSDLFELPCPSDNEDFISVKFSVRAVNLDKNTLFYGPFSETDEKKMCHTVVFKDHVPVVIAVSVSIFIIILILFITVRCFQTWYPGLRKWIRIGIPDLPDDNEQIRPDDMTSISTDPNYIEEWVQNLVVYQTDMNYDKANECYGNENLDLDSVRSDQCLIRKMKGSIYEPTLIGPENAFENKCFEEDTLNNTSSGFHEDGGLLSNDKCESVDSHLNVVHHSGSHPEDLDEPVHMVLPLPIAKPGALKNGHIDTDSSGVDSMTGSVTSTNSKENGVSKTPLSNLIITNNRIKSLNSCFINPVMERTARIGGNIFNNMTVSGSDSDDSDDDYRMTNDIKLEGFEDIDSKVDDDASSQSEKDSIIEDNLCGKVVDSGVSCDSVQASVLCSCGNDLEQIEQGVTLCGQCSSRTNFTLTNSSTGVLYEDTGEINIPMEILCRKPLNTVFDQNNSLQIESGYPSPFSSVC